MQDARLNWKARGLLAYLLSLPDGWDVGVGDPDQRGPDRRTVVYSALHELRAAGYVTEEVTRHPTRGYITDCAWVVWETPKDAGPHFAPPPWRTLARSRRRRLRRPSCRRAGFR
jgi:hypothetical protein